MVSPSLRRMVMERRPPFLIRGIGRISILVGFAAPLAQGQPRFTGLGASPGGGGSTHAKAVSGDGRTVVGIWHPIDLNEAFIWTEQTGILGLGYLADAQTPSSVALAVSYDGSFVAGYSFNSVDGIEAFRWTEDTGMVGLGDIPGAPFDSRAYDVSDDGSVATGKGSVFMLGPCVGIATRWLSGPGPLALHNDCSHAFGISADGSTIVGFGEIPAGTSGDVAFRWTEATGIAALGTLPDAGDSRAEAISSDGSTIVGHVTMLEGDDPPRAFRWTAEEGMVSLGDFPGEFFGTEASAVNGNGSMIVGRVTFNPGEGAFIWDATTCMRDFPQMLVDLGLDLTGWDRIVPSGISDDGTVVVGSGTHEGHFEGWMAHIPPPPVCGVDVFTSNCAAEAPTIPAGPHDAPKHRYVSIVPDRKTCTALRVELASMKRCTGNPARACVEDGDCEAVSPGIGPCAEHPDLGKIWWVMEPRDEPLGCLPGPCGATDKFARVEPRPADVPLTEDFRFWDLEVLHIGDCEIVPAATYEIRACLPPDGTVCSDPLSIGTIAQPFISPGFRGNFGDVAGPVEGTQFTPPDGFGNIVDVSAYILTAQNYGTANTPQAHPTWVDLHGLVLRCSGSGDNCLSNDDCPQGETCAAAPGNPPQYILNVSDLGQILKGLQGGKWTDDPGNLNPGSCP